MGNNNILFLTLKIFSSTGGIEKVCRIAGKALYETGCETGVKVKIYSMYDSNAESNDKYFPSAIFRGLRGNKEFFVIKSIQEGLKSKVIILSHINLLIIGYLIKLLSPKTKLVLIAHGIEVWKPFSYWKKKMLSHCDIILPVSLHTKNIMQGRNRLPDSKFIILNNCLDPYLPLGNVENKRRLFDRYNLSQNDKIVITVTRVSSKEKYKGYDQVLEAIHRLIRQRPELKYLLIGKYDEIEKARLDSLVCNLNIKEQVRIIGFVEDNELADHFSLGSVFVMPSEKEGFGLVFIEAMYYGIPVIAGNKDGSADALRHGELGQLVNPSDIDQITSAITKALDQQNHYKAETEKVNKYFGYAIYKNNLQGILNSLKN
jgi:phosphatidyl-myo-inositol dimannoside synthase